RKEVVCRSHCIQGVLGRAFLMDANDLFGVRWIQRREFLHSCSTLAADQQRMLFGELGADLRKRFTSALGVFWLAEIGVRLIPERRKHKSRRRNNGRHTV